MTEHARALALLGHGEIAAARELLRQAIRDALEPEWLNDLAVLAVRESDAGEAVDLLRAAVRLYPDYPEAAENLAALEAHAGQPPLQEPATAGSELLRVGHRSYIFRPPKITVYDGDPMTPITIGAYCSISENVEFVLGGNHRPDWVSTYPLRSGFGLPGALDDGHPASRGPITIGNDVWIAKNTVILSGVTIGDGAVVGANAVVASDVRPYAIVVGNPAREVRRRFNDEHVQRLLEIQWWLWPDEEVIAAVDLLNGPSVDEFLDYAARRSQA